MKRTLPNFCEFMENYLPGRPTTMAALNKGLDPFDDREVKRGIEVEKEHTKDDEIAKQIALDHLKEKPDYYAKLRKVEGPKKESIDEIIKLDLNSPKWIGPPTGLEKSMAARGEKPFVSTSHKASTSFRQGLKVNKTGSGPLITKVQNVNLNPTEVRGMARQYGTSDAEAAETAVAHELGHMKDQHTGKLDASKVAQRKHFDKGEKFKMEKERFKDELRANRQGENLLKIHGRPPMHKGLKKGTIASYHAGALETNVLDKTINALTKLSQGQEPSPNEFRQGDKAMRQHISYRDRLTRQGIQVPKVPRPPK